MAYEDGNYRIVVRGNVGDSEAWYNTWTFDDATGAQDVAEVGAILAQFYTDITTFASWLSTAYSVVGAQAKALDTGNVTDLAGFTMNGSSTDELIPTQLAMRVSLKASPTLRGGPYLTGFVTNAIDGGLITASCVSDFVDALEDFWGAVVAAGWQWCVDSPTDEIVQPVLSGRVGHRFDVIRKRAAQTAEAYSAITP